VGASGRAQGCNIFCVQAKCQPYSGVLYIKKMYSGVQEQSLWSGNQKASPESETFLAFGLGH